MILSCIENAKSKLLENNVKPHLIKMSEGVHDMLVEELNQKDGRGRRKGTRLFEIFGLKVEIDNECPPMCAYVEGKDV